MFGSSDFCIKMRSRKCERSSDERWSNDYRQMCGRKGEERRERSSNTGHERQGVRGNGYLAGVTWCTRTQREGIEKGTSAPGFPLHSLLPVFFPLQFLREIFSPFFCFSLCWLSLFCLVCRELSSLLVKESSTNITCQPGAWFTLRCCR